MGTFSLKLVGPGCHWLGLDVPSTGTACGVIGDTTRGRAKLWQARKVRVHMKTLRLGSPSPAPPPVSVHDRLHDAAADT